MIRKATDNEVAKAFMEEEFRRFEAAFRAGTLDFSVEAMERDEELMQARRRKFFCEAAEDSYRKLLEAAREGPRKDEARTALARMIDENIRWARNNIAAHGTANQEFFLYTRMDELALQYRELLNELAGARPPATLGSVAAKMDALNSKAEAIHDDTRELKAAVPAVVAEQAKAIRDRDADIAQLKAALSKRIADLFVVFKQVAPEDMQVFLAYMREGNQVKAAARLGMKEQTLRARVERWVGRSPAYTRIHSLYQWRKRTNQSPKEIPFLEAAKYDEHPAPDVEAHILEDIAEIVQDITHDNLEVKREELLTKYLKEYE